MATSEEPVWFVRMVLWLMLVGFAMFLGREAWYLVDGLRRAAGT